MRELVKTGREHYLSQRWKLEQVDFLLARGKISQAEYDYIVGGDEPPTPVDETLV